MCRWLVVLLLMLAVPVGPAGARGDDDPELLKALALQRVMQKTILDTEASIACILVTRSELYQRGDQGAGKLGAYDPELIKIDPNLSEKERQLKQKKLN